MKQIKGKKSRPPMCGEKEKNICILLMLKLLLGKVLATHRSMKYVFFGLW
jgi:hypothetical protein